MDPEYQRTLERNLLDLTGVVGSLLETMESLMDMDDDCRCAIFRERTNVATIFNELEHLFTREPEKS